MIQRMRILIQLVVTVALAASVADGFTAQRQSVVRSRSSNSYSTSKRTRFYSTQPPPSNGSSSSASASASAAAAEAETSTDDDDDDDDDEELVYVSGPKPTPDWEIDCYSRPVVVAGGKKLWEVLITDSTGSFRYRKALPSNKVNSKELRAVVERLIETIETEPPAKIRFFRGAMFNMINIALSDIDVVGSPSRCTFALAQWIEERNRDVYPKMEGYRPTMAGLSSTPSFLNVRAPIKLPDALRGEKYAFVSLPLAEFREGGGVNADNIGMGKLCPIDPTLPADSFVQGVVVLSRRPQALASWLAGTEVAGVSCDLRKRALVIDTNIDTQYLMAKLNDEQREEGAAFEEGKDRLNGLHFVCVQKNEETDPTGFWLLREIPGNI